MTEITKLYIGNRQSGKTTKLIEELSHNLLHDPHTPNIIFSSMITKAEIMQKLPDGFRNPKVSVNRYATRLLSGASTAYLYLDEIDAADRREALFTVGNLYAYQPKSIHINATPMFLREGKNLNTNHNDTRDPLIKALQITDFEFDFLFNEKMADTLYNTNFPHNREIFYTQGLGMISLFD